MKKEDLLNSLNWFYTLELNQVDLYKALSEKFSDNYEGIVFEHIAQIEQGHADNIAAKIKELGSTPTTLGEVISPIIGTSLATILSLSGLDMVHRINIKIEEKAMSDYSKLIEDLEKDGETPDSPLSKLLKYNYIDEQQHASLFATLIGSEPE